MAFAGLKTLYHAVSDIPHKMALKKAGGLDVVTRVKAERLSYLNFKKYVQICQTIARLKRDGVQGSYLEAGCALGGSSIVIGTLRPSSAMFRVYDVFGMIPPPTDKDTPDVIERYKVIVDGKSKGLQGDTYYGYIADLHEVVQANLQRHLRADALANIHLLKGLLQDTMVIDGPVAFAHIDVDWYDPVLVSLHRVAPHLSLGGTIILDDYFDWGGCRKAVDEFLSGDAKHRFTRDARFGSLALTRTV